MSCKDSANECHEACFKLLRCSLSYAKIVQMSVMKACFQMAECSLSYAKLSI